MHMDVNPLNGKTAINRVYHQLRQKILKGELAPGEKLKIVALTALLDTGASPIREALSLLTSDGLVKKMDQRGFLVSPISAANFKEILMLRCNLDDLALRKSIECGGSEWEEQLVLIHHRLARADSSDVFQWEDLHKAYHMGLISGCDCPILLGYCHQLYDQNIRYRFLAETSSNYKSRNVVGEHDQIFQATMDRDADKASELLLKHYSETGNFFYSLLEQSTLNEHSKLA